MYGKTVKLIFVCPRCRHYYNGSNGENIPELFLKHPGEIDKKDPLCKPCVDIEMRESRQWPDGGGGNEGI